MPSMTRNVRDRQVKGLPHELVKNYTVEALSGGKTVWSKDVDNNSQRLNIHEIPEGVDCDAIRITVRETYGYRRREFSRSERTEKFCGEVGTGPKHRPKAPGV